ncbi:9283_t:CDS:2, partial [Dentiscutata erythropus]
MPMWFDMPRNTTIDFEGICEVAIKTTENEKLRFTVVLGNTTSGKKLLPAVIFKLKKTKRQVSMRFCGDHGTLCKYGRGFDDFYLYSMRKGGFTKKVNCKRALYELVCEWVSEMWREISTDLLARFFEAAGLTLNSNGSEDEKMTSHFQAIIANYMNE